MDILDQINARQMGHIKIVTAQQAKATFAYIDIIFFWHFARAAAVTCVSCMLNTSHIVVTPDIICSQ